MAQMKAICDNTYLGKAYTLFKSRGQDTKKIAGEIRGCHENTLAKSLSLQIPMALRQGHKDLEAKGQLSHEGARFEALCKGVLMAASDFSCNFFRIPTSGFEQCADWNSSYNQVECQAVPYSKGQSHPSADGEFFNSVSNPTSSLLLYNVTKNEVLRITRGSKQ